MTANARQSNGHRRRNLRARILREETHCAICGHEVDKSIKTPDPLSPEIDEIIPVSQGGNPLDRKNTQLVHRACNRCKGTGKHTGSCLLCQTTPPTNLIYVTTRQW